MMAKDPHALVWLDLETTGIDDRSSTILEIATIVTDRELNVVEEGPNLVIHHPNDVLANMDPWCVEQHGSSGLTEASRRSEVSMVQAEEASLAFVRTHCLRDRAPLCGNSIGFDRRFTIHHMPRLNAYLSYRNVDVSTLKELVDRWYPGVVEKPEKEPTHRALDDIRESIEELRRYRRAVFKDLP
jgi:oligoribonuclease